VLRSEVHLLSHIVDPQLISPQRRIYFLRNEQPSVSLALPPVGWQRTVEQPAQITTVCACEKTVVIVKQPGHLTSMKKDLGTGTSACEGRLVVGHAVGCVSVVPSACAFGPQPEVLGSGDRLREPIKEVLVLSCQGFDVALMQLLLVCLVASGGTISIVIGVLCAQRGAFLPF